ncbi:intraflagellar transport protein 140 homolog [Lineus longissimus]|uniref:intraflagellar transport protein 140 homolog n=1 Tax=Lineus longissimus TaxID=88925 RepID=UPI002B4D1CBC
MAVYFDFKLQSSHHGNKTNIAWHENQTILAVSSYNAATGGCVNLYQDEGEVLPHGEFQRSSPPTCVRWHPTKKIVAIGWDTGEIIVWNEHERELHDVPTVHRTDIKAMEWSSSGTRLLTGDSSGFILVFKVDARGRVQHIPLCQHNVHEGVTKVLLKPLPPVDPNNDLKALARAAVSGDENALDMFTWRRGKDGMKGPSLLPSEAQSFFIGLENGGVSFINEAGKLVNLFTIDEAVKKLLYYEEKNILVTIGENLILSQHSVTTDGDAREIMKVKLSGKAAEADVIWAGKGVLATVSGESVVRLWDIDREENYILNADTVLKSTGEQSQSYGRDTQLTCVSYSIAKQVLAVGTSSGTVAMWKYSSLGIPGKKAEPEDKWHFQPPSNIEGNILQIEWGPRNLLAVNAVEVVYVLSEQVMSAHYADQIAVLQTGPTMLSVNIFGTGTNLEVKTDFQVKGTYTTKEFLAVWNNKKFTVYEYTPDKSAIRPTGTFATESHLNCLYEQNVYTVEPGKVQVRTHQGTVKQLISFTELEGDPIFLDICGNFLAIGSEGGFIKIYDLSRREAKQHASPKNLHDVIPGFGRIESVRVNSTGNRVSIIASNPDGSPDPKLYIWDVELDTLQFFNFESGKGEQDDFDTQTADDEYISAEERGKNQAAKDIAGRYPLSHYWDSHESKLLVCEAKLLRGKQQKEDENKEKAAVSLSKHVMEDKIETMIVSLFSTPENGILLQDNFAMNLTYSGLIGLEVPYYYFIKKTEESEDQTAQITDRPQTSMPNTLSKLVARWTMRDFVGLEYSDKNTRDAMLNFSYYLTIGNMDEAFKAIKLIKNESVWENMAKMCVKSRRLDVASVCLGNMGHARGAKALREAMKEPELDAQVAVLAIQLGLTEDAERLLKNCQRYDLLNEFYQSTGQWNKAMDTSEMYDRVHLRTTYYNYAKHLEAKGDITSAVPVYEKADTHRFEVPRMLFEEPQALEAYIMKTKDKALRKWWAQYMESTGEMETALQFYEAAQDYLSLVRVYCYCGNLEKAAEICNDTGDAAGCYHLARQYENQDRIKEAIHFFTRAQAYGNAIRLCKEHGYEDQMMNLALLGKPQDMMDAARYYESKPSSQDKAVMLYHKAGNLPRALDLAFRTRQFGALQHISDDLDQKADPELLQRCANFFTENGQYDKAVDLLATARKYWDALKLCSEQNVVITEDLAEKLTPQKATSEPENDERIKILNGIAEVCMQQRQYHLATKKYTQAGNKLQAMKALLKSGDTEKIIFFAGVSRQKEIYVMAANYLQSLDWRKDPEIMKNIIGFYTKGRAMESLASFYDACAMVEIDEYQNYDKALGALGEAYKCVTRAKLKNQSQQEEKLTSLKNRIDLIKKFVQARRVYDDSPDEAVKQCQILLEEPDLDQAVRIGDVFGFMIEHYARKEKWKAAYACMEEMKNRIPKVNMAYYVNMRTIESIHRALDIPLPRGQGPDKINGMNGFGKHDNDELDGEEVQEDVIDEIVPGGDDYC